MTLRLSPTHIVIYVGAFICIFLLIQFFPTAEIYDSLIYSQSNKSQIISDSLLLNAGKLSSNKENGSDPNASLVGSTDGEKILNFLRTNMGFSDFGCFAVMGNWKRESGLDPNAVEGYYTGSPEREALAEKINSGQMTMEQWMNYQDRYPGRDVKYGYGLAQWTYPSRQENLWKFAESRGTKVSDLETQLLFFKQEWEAYDKDGSVTQQLKTANSIDAMHKAASAFEHKYEGSSAGYDTKRHDCTAAVYIDYKDTPKPSTTTSSSTNSPSIINTSGQDWQKWILEHVEEYLNIPYVYKGMSHSGADCSGLTWLILKEAGAIDASTPRYSSGTMNSYGYQKISDKSQLQVGDIICWPGSHVALYIGDYNGISDACIDAQQKGIKTKISTLDNIHKNESEYYYRPTK